jgi:hypothetical protein
METPVQAARRLLGAFEQLVAEETAAVHANDFSAIESVQERAGVVGVRLAELTGDSATADLRRHVETLLAQREQNSAVLAQRLTDVSAEIERLQGARRCLRRVAPAYGQPSGQGARFTAAA